jgi:hypothetical protein
MLPVEGTLVISVRRALFCRTGAVGPASATPLQSGAQKSRHSRPVN